MANILVLDDEASLLRLIVTILERGGHTVTSFQKPLEALSKLEHFVPDAIISDISMPVMTGLEFCKKVREIPHLQTIPFIFLTALSERPDMRAGMNVGADDYLLKPFTPSEILEAVQVRLKRAALLRPAIKVDSSSLAMTAKALGGINVVYKGTEVAWVSKKAAEFFFYLLERPNGVTTWEAAEALWRDKDESRAASVFHTTLHRLRKTLDEDVVFTKNRRYYLKTDLEIEFDVTEYHQVVRQSETAPEENVFANAIKLYGGAYMAGCDSVWCEDKREMLHATHLSLLLEASRFAETKQDLRRAAWYAHLATQHETFADQAWTALARVYESLGDTKRSDRAKQRLAAWDE
jgi:two-component SAPR family response regulator